jgi:hypothetical protein
LEEAVTAGLTIIGTDELPKAMFSKVVFGSVEVHFVEADYFSIKRK